MGCSTHKGALGMWLTWVALLAQELDCLLYLGPYWLLVAIVYTTVVVYGCSALPSSPRDL